MHIVVVGAGYVGLVSGTCLADFGHDVVIVDNDRDKVEALRHGRVPIYEPGLARLIARNVSAGRVSFTDTLAAAVAEADVVFIAVGTPARRGDGAADLSFVHAAARELAPHLTGFTVIVTKSTVPVGTGDAVERIIREINPSADFAVASNPEFLREGSAIADFKQPDRVVVGFEDERARATMAEVYRPLLLKRVPVLFTRRRTSELIKYAANAFLAMKITFINEAADLCEAVGADVQEVALGLGLDRRVGAKFLDAGPGYGGSCFPKDTLAIVKIAQDHDVALSLVEATVAANDRRKRAMGRKVIAAAGGNVRGRTIGLLGLTFKPNTDDMRDAPSLAIVQALLDAGAAVRAYDPEGMPAARPLMPQVTFCDTPYDVAVGAIAVAIVTEWEAFSALDLRRLGARMANPLLIDLRNQHREEAVTSAGIAYVGIGKPPVQPPLQFLEAAE